MKQLKLFIIWVNGL